MATYKKTAYDDIAEDLVVILRKLQDVNVQIVGTKAQVIRITMTDADIFGDAQETLVTSGLINNAIIAHPLGSNIQLFGEINDSSKQFESSAIDLWDVLPFTMRILFEGNYYEDIQAIKKDDLIVDILYDEHGTKIPIVFQVSKVFGGFMNKFLATKKFELALFRGQTSTEVQDAINSYIT